MDCKRRSTPGPAQLISKYNRGDKVFAKMSGWPPWPAMILDKCTGKVEKYSVIFYGTHDSADVKPPMIYPCNEENIQKYGKAKEVSVKFKTAMDEMEAQLAGSESKPSLEKIQKKLVKASTKPEPVPVAAAFQEPETVGSSKSSNSDGNIDVDPRPLLLALQHEPEGSNDTDCVIKCYDGEIRVHAVLFRNWLAEQSLASLPENIELDLNLWTIAEVAPLVFLMYSTSSVKLNLKSVQAFKKIQHSMSKMGLVINLPKEPKSVVALDPAGKFRCMKTGADGKKYFYFFISKGKFVDACEKCKFSGSMEEINKHVKDCHEKDGDPMKSAESVLKAPDSKLQKGDRRVRFDLPSDVNTKGNNEASKSKQGSDTLDSSVVIASIESAGASSGHGATGKESGNSLTFTKARDSILLTGLPRILPDPSETNVPKKKPKL